MRVDRNRRLVEGHVENDVGGFPADAGKRDKLLHRAGDLSAVLVDKDAAGLHDVRRLRAVEVDGVHVGREVFEPQGKDLFRGIGDGKELRGGEIDALVGRLRGEHDGDEKFKGRGVVQFRFGIGIELCERRHEGSAVFL